MAGPDRRGYRYLPTADHEAWPMCDEFTDADSVVAAARERLSRRQFGLIGAAAAVATAGHGTGANSSSAAAPALAEQAVTVLTPDCTADAFFVHPPTGMHPGIVLWPDIAGLRDAYKTTARAAWPGWTSRRRSVPGAG